LKKSAWRNLAMFAIAVVVVILDQYTKAQVREHLPLNESWNPIPWLDRFVTFTYTRNVGAAFGLFPALSSVFKVIPIIVVGAIVFYFRKLAATSWLLQVAFGFEMAGALGNLIDRLTVGYVTDFVDVRIWPIFNVADASIVFGTALLAYYALFIDRPSEASQAQTEQPPSTEPGE